MHWIAVHEEVLGSKLRGLRKQVNCSEAEALGILTILWLWARKNTDKTGYLANTDKEDIAKAISPYLDKKLDADDVTEALIEHGWLDDIDGQLFVHDWEEWQSYWYNYLEKREKDKERKRVERAKAKDVDVKVPEPPQPPSPPAEDDDGKEKKLKFADTVKLYQKEWDSLVEKFGEPFASKLIEELDYYKGSSGKRYKSDYKAILNWVVEKCEKKYPQLKKVEKKTETSSSNPFESYK